MKTCIWKSCLSGILVVMATAICSCQPNSGNELSFITVPDGFKIEVYADDVPGARSMALSPNGTLFVGSRGAGNVYALRDKDGDNRIDEVLTIASGLSMPNGVAFRDGSLYVAEISRILRFDNIEEKLSEPPPFIVLRDDYPRDTHHGWKFIAFGPDDKLYIPVGAPCNICLEQDERYASITRMNPDGSDVEVFAYGVRNTVGFDWHPATQELWFTDNGADLMGDDLPPDELNHAQSAGLHFGFPYCHGGEIPDADFGELRGCEEFTAPAKKLGAHVAALGMRFYTGEMFPDEYKGKILVAEHGSWNRSTKVGYRVMMLGLEGNTVVSYEPFAQGWLQAEEEVFGRPVDVLVMPDGSLLVSDDYADRIYRISYGE
jgi:glucose/arabinose dehydrogenase